MMAQDWAVTCEPIDHGRFINQFRIEIITLRWLLERINTKICRQKRLYCLIRYVLTKKCYPNTHTHTHTHIYIYFIYIYIYPSLSLLLSSLSFSSDFLFLTLIPYTLLCPCYSFFHPCLFPPVLPLFLFLSFNHNCDFSSAN